MTGPELRAIRQRLGLTLYAFGLALGYRGSRNAVQVTVARLESGRARITPQVERLATMYARRGVPREFMRSGHARPGAK
ncbi:MAG TPA: hypothetical protein VNK91_12225 [Burkholderiaceae bacterium]|nr:hypothetical protein [Burkholderiaceae bacterium]